MKSGMTRWKMSPSKKGRFSTWPVLGLRNGLSPRARPTKLATVMGALSGNSSQVMRPCEVSKTARSGPLPLMSLV